MSLDNIITVKNKMKRSQKYESLWKDFETMVSSFMYCITLLIETNCSLVWIEDTKDNTNDDEDDSKEQLQ